MPSLSKRLRIYRKLRYRKGYGVHSPFVFNLITKVIEEKSPYYIFDEIENIRQNLLKDKNVVSYTNKKGRRTSKTISSITAKETQSPKYGALLFRLMNFFQCKHVVEIGASTGIMGLYLASAYSDCKCIALENREALVAIAQKTSNHFQAKRIFVKSGDFIQMISGISGELPKIDLIFINTASDPDLTKSVLMKCLPLINEDTILVVDGINKNKKMKVLWKCIRELTQARLTIDLYALGLVFFNHKLYKKHYITYFDHGKKQNIYSNRRQRFNIFSRRKKDFQNRLEA